MPARAGGGAMTDLPGKGSEGTPNAPIVLMDIDEIIRSYVWRHLVFYPFPRTGNIREKVFNVRLDDSTVARIGMYSRMYLPTGNFARKIFQWLLKQSGIQLLKNPEIRELKISLPPDPVDAFREIMGHTGRRGPDIQKQLKTFVIQLTRMAHTQFYIETKHRSQRRYRTILPIKEISLWNGELESSNWKIIDRGRPSLKLIFHRSALEHRVVLSEDFVRNVLHYSGESRHKIFPIDDNILAQLGTLLRQDIYQVIAAHIYNAQLSKQKNSLITWDSLTGEHFFGKLAKNAADKRQRKFRVRNDIMAIVEIMNRTYSNLNTKVFADFTSNSSGVFISGDPPLTLRAGDPLLTKRP